ncbi:MULTISPECIES: TnsA endonuclease N-terminal domain-containing protein [unclassified Neptuniibacter]|uniref:TnsA endonuclease N-terminal domain-containing protein n=1 Tax=unclassified Neptuniibacter TaxID=2630693 RepID=UPI000C4F5428|nr:MULTISPECIES: TnsA endonuclease N-terminal domain-containing protein [unclassified Neptuniibacter]MAY43503.1 hypothetical protein [Oceanospirillaceae bacterium]|tara:strand:+ start:22529 stop:23140 length:612 start_codon:yes stop_codon:yes gene_type:complete
MKARKVSKQSYVRSTYHVYSSFTRRVSALESKLEQDYFNLLNFERDAIFVAQPESVRYKHGAKLRRYTPDFEVTMQDGPVFVDEVKFSEETLSDYFQEKCYLLTRFFAREDKVFRVVTEKQIRVGKREQNLRFLQPALRSEQPHDEFLAFTKKLPIRTATISQIADLLQEHKFRPCLIRRAVAHRLFRCDLTQPWEPSLQLSW